jgi:site-specific DNA-methyltransferase (adenine-specific)
MNWHGHDIPDPDWVSPCGEAILYNADCLEILPKLPDECVDAVVTDPPWRASNGSRILRRAGDVMGVGPCKKSKSTSLRYGSIGEFSSEVLASCAAIASCDVLVLCGYMELSDVLSAVGKVRQVFVWHNTRPTPIPGPIKFRDVSFIVWGGEKTTVAKSSWESCLFSHASLQAGCMATERILNSDGSTAHPAQEPLALFIDIIRPLSGSVLEPYMGSGTTGVACARLGRKFIGIEIEPKYFEIAKTRIDQELRQGKLAFDTKGAKR